MHGLEGSSQSFAVLWGTPFVLIGQYMIWGRFLYRYWAKKRTYHALTRRRALIVRDGLAGRSCASLCFESVVIEKQVRGDRIGSISFGGPVRGEWRWKGSPPRPPTFDDINDADPVYRTVTRLQSDAQKSAMSPPDR